MSRVRFDNRCLLCPCPKSRCLKTNVQWPDVQSPRVHWPDTLRTQKNVVSLIFTNVFIDVGSTIVQFQGIFVMIISCLEHLQHEILLLLERPSFTLTLGTVSSEQIFSVSSRSRISHANIDGHSFLYWAIRLTTPPVATRGLLPPAGAQHARSLADTSHIQLLN